MANRKAPRIKSWARLWQRRGFGVHSPYAYRLITEVLREKSHFYAYEELAEMHPKRMNPLRRRALKKKRARLFFRIVNRYQPTNILQIGSAEGIAFLYMKYARRETDITVAEWRSEQAQKMQALIANKGCDVNLSNELPVAALQRYLRGLDVPPFILVNKLPAEMYEGLSVALSHALQPNAVIIIDGIGKKTPRRVWRELVSDERVRLSIDMKQCGLILCDPKLNKQTYYI